MRKLRRLSQGRLAEVTGLSRSTIQRLEAGTIENPPLRNLVNCALALNCELAEICEPEWLTWTTFEQKENAPEKPPGWAKRSTLGA